jgi:hypothetical protein
VAASAPAPRYEILGLSRAAAAAYDGRSRQPLRPRRRPAEEEALMTTTAPTRPPSAAARATLVALAAASLLSACGGGGDAPPAGPSTLVVTGSTSSVATAAAPAWRERLLAWLLPGAAHAAPVTAGSPTVLRLRFHSLWISPYTDCREPTVVQTYDPPREFNLFDAPTLFAGTPAAGTYHCLIFEADDLKTIVPDAAAQTAFPAHCRVGTEYTTDLYRAPDNDFRRLDGSVITARGSRAVPVRDRVYFYASTDRAAVTARGPSIHQTLPLTAPLVVPGRTTLYVDATNGLLGDVEDGIGFCAVEGGVMGFR